ncbi:uncharacterized protein [Halyomorpha halys]|uniref:uncharacterized protein n=1 Tax=Halyomorpha halys TaxID=286706 RepID=UPI0006D5135D|nr:uncharacterized protein LOC106690141 [Halyomorpha halys]
MMALTDVGVQPNVTIKVEEDQEVSEVKGCYIWLSESTQPNLLDETGGGKGGARVKRRRCSVANCNNFLYKSNTLSEPRCITFHKFPKDEKTRAIWVELCNRTDKFSAKSSFVCSAHFKPEDYVKNCLDPLERRANRLKPGAIPSLKLPEVRLSSSKLEDKITQDEQMESSHEEEENDLDLTKLHSSSQYEPSSIRNKDELMEPPQEEEEEDSSFTAPPCTSQKEELTNHRLDFSSDVVTISSSEDDDTNEVSLNEAINERLKGIRKRLRLDLLKNKYDDLQCSFEKLKSETSEEIERLNNIITNKEDEFSRELREVLSVFLKPELVESVVEQTVW